MVLEFIPIMIVWCLFFNNPLQNNPSTSEKLSSLDKQAVANMQRILASDLDVELPKLPFANWFGQIVGPEAGLIWQLSECGEQLGASPESARDMQACVEANAILPDGRKVVVMINVGTFKKGMTHTPEFYYGVIEQQEQLYMVRRLRDLPELLRSPESLVNGPRVRLPMVAMPKYMAELAEWSGRWPHRPMKVEALLTPPPPQVKPQPSIATSPAENQKVPESSGTASWGNAITKVQPRYPANAKRVKASGPVEVQITISEAGRVIEAKAISGHPLLREAAVEAARQWVFAPATLNGVPVEAQMVVTFDFRVPQ